MLVDPVLTYLESLGFAPTGDYNWIQPVTEQTPEEIAANRDASRAQLGVDERAAEIAAARRNAQPVMRRWRSGPVAGGHHQQRDCDSG